MSNSNDTSTDDTTIHTVDDLPVVAEAQLVDEFLGKPDAYHWQPYKPTILEQVGLFFYNTQLRAQRFLRQLHRKLPRLVWYGDEIDVKLMFTGFKYSERLALPSTTADIAGYLAKEEAVRVQHGMDEIGTATAALHNAGIGFDTGFGALNSGEWGREWFLDYSLKGPMRVKFLGKTKNTLARKE